METAETDLISRDRTTIWLGRKSATALLALPLVLASCGSTTVAKAKETTRTKAPVQAAAKKAAAPLVGPIGTAYSYSGTDNNGNSIQMDVTLTALTDPATGTAYETPNPGYRFVGTTFKLVGVKGTYSDDANSDAIIIGSNQQTYSPSFDSLANCTNFNAGVFTVTPGQVSVGCVAFQLPNGVSVKSVQWNPNQFGGGSPATWTVSSGD